MKKIFCLLGAFISVGLVTQAKEVVVQPSQEAIIIEEPVPKFKPTATLIQELEYFGPMEGDAERSRYRFRPLEGNAQFTKALSADFRARFNMGHGNTNSDFRNRWYYNQGNLGESLVNWTHRLKFEKDTKFQSGGGNYDPSAQQLVLGLTYLIEYESRFNFSEYFPKYEHFKVSNFTLAPSYGYMWDQRDSSNDAHSLALDFYSNYDLPWGFSAEFNMYFMRTWSAKSRLTEIGKPVITEVDGKRVAKWPDTKFTKEYSSIAVEFYIYNTTLLLESYDKRTKLTFEFEGGYDPFLWTSKNLAIYDINEPKVDSLANIISAGNAKLSNKTYYLKAIPELRITHQFTDATKGYVRFKGEYGNQINQYQIAKQWRWQPQVVVGWSTNF